MTAMFDARSTSFRSAFLAEIKLSAGILLRPAIAIVGLVLLVGLTATIFGIRLDFTPSLGRAVAVVSMVTPLAIWRDEALFGRRAFFDRPVSKPVLIATRGGAGLIWVMVGALVLTTACLVLASVTGGRFDPPQAPFGIQRALTAVAAPRPWAFFPLLSAATIAYVAGTAIAVGVRFPLRWTLAGLAAILIVWLLAAEMGTAAPVTSILNGPFGLDAALTGGWRPTLDAGPDAALTPGSFASWLGAVGIWLGLALGVATLAALRHRDP